MSKLVVVIGLTGQQGGSVAEELLKHGWRVRGVTRNPNKAQSWSDRGVEVVQGDLDDKASLLKAFKGAYGVFGTTDFWGPVFDPSSKSKLKDGQKINEYAFDIEVAQAKNIAEAAAETEGLQRFVSSALPNVNECTSGRLKHVYHFDSKAVVVEYIKKSLPELARKMSVIYIGSYMTNWGQGLQPKQKSDGTWHLSLVGKGDTPIPLLFTAKDTGILVRSLLEDPPGRTMSGSCDMLSWKECLEIWCETQGLTYGGFDETSIDEFVHKSGMGPDLGLEFAEMFEFMDSPGYNGTDRHVMIPKECGSVANDFFRDLV
ncbi:hypothetical protein LTR84_001969 [Exophiala bonariae]|uniref:NmrA-like domain-containing protein n=1 Tax=Exophiala bonariae TaxID=1690606 RepID=A0AAV9NGL1_9EURO|nr:hypothetical protein LTR84_001969 [Exophiala bonariae]